MSLHQPAARIIDRPGRAPSLQYLGQRVVQHRATFDDTVIGGLSGISYDPSRQMYYIISDDRSTHRPIRFYVARLSVSDRGIDDVSFVATRFLLDESRHRFPPLNIHTQPPTIPPDPEGIAFDPRRQQLYWSSEGDLQPRPPAVPIIAADPAVLIAGLDGDYKGKFALPPAFSMSLDGRRGPRPNQSFEGLTLTPDGEFLFVAMEEPLIEDGPVPNTERGALVRITKFHVDSRKPIAQYAYPLDRSAPTADTNGISDLVALSGTSFLVIERAGTSTPGITPVVRIYHAEIGSATDVLAYSSLPGAAIRPMIKSLAFDFADVSPVDNVEGITLGPLLPDGRQSVILVSDDNFLRTEITQFLAFAIQNPCA
jgi:hypothetical protein